MNDRIARQRLARQRLTDPLAGGPADVVAWHGAVQAQDYPAAKWALAQRMTDRVTTSGIEREFDAGRFVRTHVLRPTWHFVAAADVHWMLELTAPRVQRTLARAYRWHGVDEDVRRRATRLIARSLARGQARTRAELAAVLLRGGVAVTGTALAMVCVHAELERVICSGAQRGRYATYALLDARAPARTPLSRDEAIAELTQRYFRSHGPATVRDFVWWSGVLTGEARRGLEMCRAARQTIDGRDYWTIEERADLKPHSPHSPHVHLLPIYDEYLVAYRDHEAVPRPKTAGGVLPQAISVRGQVAGTWKAVTSAGAVTVQAALLRPFTAAERRGLARACERYGAFLERPVALAGG